MKVYNNWSTDLDNTQPALKKLSKILFTKGEGNLISIEKTDNEVLMWLDKYSGIDWIGKTFENNLVSFAGRIQWDNNWGTFTIRYKRATGTKTEYEKRLEAIEKGYMYPNYTVQAYFTKDYDFLGGAYMKTIDLYKSFNEFGYNTRQSDNVFIFKTFAEIKKEGFNITILDAEKKEFISAKDIKLKQFNN